MLGKELAALHESHGMGMDLLYGLPLVVGQTTDAMGNMQLVLPHYTESRIAEQLVVVQETTRNARG